MPYKLTFTVILLIYLLTAVTSLERGSAQFTAYENTGRSPSYGIRSYKSPILDQRQIQRPGSINYGFQRRGIQSIDKNQPQRWPGKWFPGEPVKKDSTGRIQMGVANALCDDAKTNLTIDWENFSPVNYTCFRPDNLILPQRSLRPLLECVTLPRTYLPKHYCMNETISYSTLIPSYGDHRPLWPKFGEYRFVPRQRWLHNIEHGAVVFLYHPCTHPSQVDTLRKLLVSCFGKHIITPSNLVSSARPLVFVAWGCRLEMAWADERLASEFIQKRALKGPEGNYPKEGQYDTLLLKYANASGNARYDKVTCHSSNSRVNLPRNTLLYY